MQYDANSPEAYMEMIPEDRKAAMSRLRDTFLQHLPKGFEEGMSYGMIGYVVPHSIYPDGYHCNPKQALPFISIASQKNFIALYHMGIYADPALLNWFQTEYAIRVPVKLDMGKSCIRFKKTEHIQFDLLAELAGKMRVEDWIQLYEKNYKR